jgi:glycosyltransferase involved in cell wall biosynthesis
MNQKLTIVIPCKNEGVMILTTLKLLIKQKLDCQIIIADSSTDDTFNILMNYKTRSPQVIRVIGGGLPAVARNKGASFVKTPYVLFLDADIYLRDPNVVNQCLDEIINKDLDLVTCKFHTVEKKYDKIYRFFDIIQWISSKSKPFAIGGFMLFKTETFNALGGFNENDKIAEDYHLSSKINTKKFKIVNTYVYTTARRFINKGTWYMVKLAFYSWLNRNNDEWFKNDYNYWI